MSQPDPDSPAPPIKLIFSGDEYIYNLHKRIGELEQRAEAAEAEVERLRALLRERERQG